MEALPDLIDHVCCADEMLESSVNGIVINLERKVELANSVKALVGARVYDQ